VRRCAAEAAQRRTESQLELVPARERKRFERDSLDARRRLERRERTRALELALCLSELWLRDLLCVSEGAAELVHAVDRRAELGQDADGLQAPRLRDAVALVGDTRLSLQVNVSEELALESLAYRLQGLLAGARAA